MTEHRDKIESDADMSNELKVEILIAETLLEIRDLVKNMKSKEEMLKSLDEQFDRKERKLIEALVDIRDVLKSIDLRLEREWGKLKNE